MKRSALTGMMCTVLAIGFAGCSESSTTTTAAPKQASKSAVPSGYKVYGGKIDPAITQVEEAKLFENPDAYNGKVVRVAGTATNVCEHRGCWLALTKGTQTIRARFVESGDCTDGFFVPRDASGHKVILQGTFKKEMITEARAKHFAEEAKVSEGDISKISGPQQVLSMVCTAVAIEGGDKLSEPLKAGQGG